MVLAPQKKKKKKNLGYFHQVSLLDYFLGSEPKVGVASSAGGCPFFFFCFVLQDSTRDKE